MTIAAGFLCKDGVMLCADTEQQAWAMKLHGSKMGNFNCANGDKVCYAYAGNTAFALSAIQKCHKRLQSKQKTDTFSEIESVLDREYRRNVLQHPDHAMDGTLPYHILLAIWTHAEQKTRLYVTAQTAIHESSTYECIGIGDSLGHYLIRPIFVMGMRRREVLSMATHALAMIKDYVPGCGGLSVFTVLKNDGTMGVITSAFHGILDQIEKHAKGYDWLARRLMTMIFDPELEEEDFKLNLTEYFNSQIINWRNEWRMELDARLARFSEDNPHLTGPEAKQLFLELSMGLLTSPRPSPGSPEGSDGS